MIVSVLDSIIPYLSKQRGELDMFLEDAGIVCFQDIFNKYEGEAPNLIISYIVHAYSNDSPNLVLGSDHTAQKLHIATNIVNLPDYLVGDCVQLKSETVNKAIGEYLDFQDAPVFKRLKYKQDLYEKLQSELLKDLSKETIDMKEVVANDKYLDQLLEDIHNEEDKLRQMYRYVYINKEDLNAQKKDTKDVSGNIESSKFIM